MQGCEASAQSIGPGICAIALLCVNRIKRGLYFSQRNSNFSKTCVVKQNKDDNEKRAQQSDQAHTETNQ